LKEKSRVMVKKYEFEEHGGLEVLTEYIRYFNLACEMYGKEEYKIDLKEEAA